VVSDDGNVGVVGFDVTGGFGLLPVKTVQAPVGGLSESYKILKLNCNSGACAGHLFFKMYHLPFGSFEYSVAFQFYNNNDTLKISLLFRQIKLIFCKGTNRCLFIPCIYIE